MRHGGADRADWGTAGDFTWTCERGRVKGSILLAPTPTPRIESLSFARATPSSKDGCDKNGEPAVARLLRWLSLD